MVAAGCGGGDDESSASTEIEGLGSTLEEIQANAKNEGQVNLVIWAGYADKSWADTFTKQTGCKVNTKDGASSDDMVDLMATGAYDGVSASGDATLRLIAEGRRRSGQLRPDAELRGRLRGPEGPVVQHGRRRRLRRTARPRCEPDGLEHGRLARADNDSWAPIWDRAPTTRASSRSTTTRSSSPTLPSISRRRSPTSTSRTRTSSTTTSSTPRSTC